MVAVQQIRSEESRFPAPAADPRTLRRATAWLVGGDAQTEALSVAFKMAQDSGADICGLTAFDPKAGLPRRAVPAGGGYWAVWQAKRRRERLRDQAASALGAFQEMADTTGVKASVRHEEGDLADILTAVAGSDLVIAPAGVDRVGSPAAYRDEIASFIRQKAAAPVLRVRQATASVNRVAILVDARQEARNLAQNFLKSGMFANAEVTLLPVGDSGAPEALANEFAELLGAHGRTATAAAPLDQSAEAFVMIERMRPFDAVVATTLSTRSGLFSLIREDAHEVAAEHAPMTLLI